MNQLYVGWHIDELLDHMNTLSKENDQLQQLVIKALRILSRPEVFEVLNRQEKVWGAEIQDSIQ